MIFSKKKLYTNKKYSIDSAINEILGTEKNISKTLKSINLKCNFSINLFTLLSANKNLPKIMAKNIIETEKKFFHIT